MTSKSELRSILKKRRQDFDIYRDSFTSHRNYEIGRLINLISGVKCLALYHATPGEPDISGLAVDARGHDVETSLPWLPPTTDKLEARAANIIFRHWSPGDPLIETALHFFQPEDDAAIVTPDLILTPLVGFDRALNRLGQGAGHYDRAFQNTPDAIRVGVAWSVQEVDQLPVDDWDIPLDAIITEKEWIVRPGGRIE